MEDNVSRIMREMTQPKENVDFGEPDIFRYCAPTLGIPFVVVHTKDFRWKAVSPFTDALRELFLGQEYFYIRGIPQHNGNLYIMEMLDDQHWEQDPEIDHRLREFIQQTLDKQRASLRPS